MTQLHLPALPHPDKEGTTGAGDMGDSMADVDYNVGLILQELKRSGIEKNTIVIWCTDNGAEMRRPWRGSPGPWRGYYNTAMEGGIRTPFVMRWPARIKGGLVSDEVVHEVDLFSTIAAAAGAPQIVPDDRIIDGVNQLPFFEGKQNHSNRESAIFMERHGTVMAVKWHHWKFWYHFQTEMPDPEPDNLARLFDLKADPREEVDVKDYYPWVVGIMDSIVNAYETSLVMHPRVAASANVADPYLPPPAGSGKLIPTYTRTDRAPLGPRSKALPDPYFTGSWSTAVLNTTSAIGNAPKPLIASLGSGWGDKITIVQKANQLEIEKVVFTPREIQPLVRYKYNLDGSTSENMISMGRTGKALVSTARWEENRLVITTLYPYQNPRTEKWDNATVIQTLWLQPPTGTPWEPTLVIETTREGVLGGKTITNRTVYSKGYR